MQIEISGDKVRSEFVAKVVELSGQNIFACYQCGKCSAGCPCAQVMDLLPNQVIRFVQLGQEEKALMSDTMWYCASCFTCYARCPKGVDLSKVMEALRLIRLRKRDDHVDPAAIPSEDRSVLPQIALISNFRKFTS